MTVVRNGHVVSTRRGSLGLWFSALLALALFDPGAAIAQEVKQIKLTDKHIQGFMAAYEDIAKVYDGAESDKPDPKVEAQAAAVANKHGFASLAQYDDVLTNITMIMSGIDPQGRGELSPHPATAVEWLRCQLGFRLPNKPSVSSFGPAVK